MRKIIKGSQLQPSSISLPSSKSLSHRALITASLANGTSVIHGLTDSADTLATKRCMERLGAKFEKNGTDIIVHGISSFQYDGTDCDCGESGSTLRFLIPIFALLNQEITFVGHGKLMQRPQSVYEEIFAKQNLLFERIDNKLSLQGPLASGKYVVKGNVSSQFMSGLLFALPLLKKDSILEIEAPFESSSYVGLTLDSLKHAGIQIKQEGLTYYIPGNQTYQPFDCTVEGDDSQMAFFAEAACIQNVPIDVCNVRHDSIQGDHVIVDIIKRMGGNVEEIENGYRFSGNQLKGCQIDLADCPDLGPALFALASQCEGTTTFINAGRLRIKESDRIACMEEELRKLGVAISSTEDVVTIHGKKGISTDVMLYGHNDHRIVMSLSMLASLTEKQIIIDGAEAVNKSYPRFFEDYVKIGGMVEDE